MKPNRLVAAAALAAIAVGFQIHAHAADREDPDVQRALKQARKEVERAREELRRATRDLARSMAKVEKNNPRAQYFEYITNPKRAMIGVIIDDEINAKKGVQVIAITPGGGAEDGGMKAGDLITGINGTSLISDREESPHHALKELMSKVEAGDTIEVAYLRNGKAHTASVKTQPPDTDFALAPLAFDHDFDFKWDSEDKPFFPPLPPNMMRQFYGPAVRGLELARLDEDLGHYFKTTEGVLVVQAPKSDALGLKSGDVIQTIDGDRMLEPLMVLDRLRSRGGERAVRLEVLRQGRKVKLEAKIPVAMLAPRPPRPARAPRAPRHQERRVVIIKDDHDD